MIRPIIQFAIPAALAAIMATQVAAAENRPVRDGLIMCPMIYLPVCGSDGAQTKIFPNKCVAEGAGFAIVSNVQCGGEPQRQFGCEPGEDCKQRPRGIRKVKPS
ncbi:MAG: hypothetical protein AB7I79_20545 [Rhizobiaceae bacterium]